MQVGKTSHAPGWFETFSMIFRRVYHSFGYGLLYGMVLLLNFGLIIWLIIDKGEPKPIELFFLIEVVVTLALVLEIVYTVKTQGFRKWVSDLSNWFDFLIAVVCTLSLGAYAIGEELQEEVAVGVASARYIAQALRLGVLLRHARRKNAQGIAEFEQVRFEINFDAQDDEGNADSFPKEPHSPTSANYWGRGRAFSASPIFQNPGPKRLPALDHTVKVLPSRTSTASPPPISLSTESDAPPETEEKDPLL